MIRLGIALMGFVGLLLAQAGSPVSFAVDYFYQNVFLSDTANVVLEFTLKDCVPKDGSINGTIEFGDSSPAQKLERITCGRWRIPHTYFGDDKSPKTYPATLKIGAKTLTTTVSVAEPMTAPPPPGLEGGATQPPGNGDGNGNADGGGATCGDGQCAPGKEDNNSCPADCPKPDVVKEYTLKLERTKFGLSGYRALFTLEKGEIIDVAPLSPFKVLGQYSNENYCPPTNKQACKFFSYVDTTDEAEKNMVWKEKTNINLATIKVKNAPDKPKLEILRADDMGPYGIFDGSVPNPVGDIPPECFCLVDLTSANNDCQAATQCPL